MSSPIESLVAELSHEINTPLAVIRNVLYLVSIRTEDAEIHRYLQIADEEVLSIVGALRQARHTAKHSMTLEIRQSKAA